MNRALAFSLMTFLLMSSSVLAQSFVDRVILSPDVSYIWNFQKGVEEVLRFVKFSSTQRTQYSLELMERRIGEIEVLVNKSEVKMVPIVAYYYEAEVDKIVADMNSTDIFSYFVETSDIRNNVTQRLDYDVQALNKVSKGVSEPTYGYIVSAIKKTQISIDFINKLQVTKRQIELPSLW